MTRAMTVRLDEDTDRKLQELAEHESSTSAAVKTAILEAWQRLQEDKLDKAYAVAVAKNPAYPYESDEERATARARRNRRHAG